ncbi:MAG: hypothetical protein HYR84_10855 [Planctomycetes bacterium]|nr:hypothetical protein [Planctomycetota bacterium]
MKVVDLKKKRPSVEDLVGLAKDQIVVLRQADGSVFALARVDEFDVEVELLRRNPKFMKLMKKFSRKKATISLKDLRKELGV